MLSSRPMKTFYYPQHIRHDPEQLHRPDTPTRNQLYSEIARRGTLIHEAIAAAGFGPIEPPADYSMAPLTAVHDAGLIEFLSQAFDIFQKETGGWRAIPNTFSVRRTPSRLPRSIWGLMGYYAFDTASPIFAGTWEATYWSAQTAVNAAAETLQTGTTSYALCRPPGHHATADLYGGYCFLNNAAIAAQWLVDQGQRVAILDVDYHHGNGTQAIFYGRSDVLFCSLHADPLDEYPNYWGFADEFGEGEGENYNFNYPMPLGTEEPAYLESLKAALAQVRRFAPDALVVSLGLDAFEGDPVGGFRLQTDSFRKIGQMIGEVGVKTAVIQEGGYQLDHLAQNTLAFFHGLLAH
ncbi:MAG: histone deacetylase family protein [Anaerolineales bacterium]|nr:histone deacetylase family protein [Anaerolineales bacterium]